LLITYRGNDVQVWDEDCSATKGWDEWVQLLRAVVNKALLVVFKSRIGELGERVVYLRRGGGGWFGRRNEGGP
jgi:hypothetical protein